MPSQDRAKASHRINLVDGAHSARTRRMPVLNRKNTMIKHIVGIDPGNDGGAAYLSGLSGSLIATVNDIADPFRLIAEWGYYGFKPDNTVIYLEDCAEHLPAASIMRSMALGIGYLHGVFAGHRYRVIKVLPRIWQKQILGKVPQGMTKPYALDRVYDLWPDHQWIPERKKRPHEGIVDAALIGLYGYQELKTQNK